MIKLSTVLKRNKAYFHTFFIFLMSQGIFIFLLSCSQDKEIAPAKDTEDPSSCTVNVKTVGAKGDGVTVDTWAFQKAVNMVSDCGGGTVYVPSGNYLIDADSSIKMKSNVTLKMVDTTARLIAKKSLQDRYYMIDIRDVDNVKIIGGKLIGDLDVHPDPNPPRKSEWGMGIGVTRSTNITITDTHVTNCWGDGIVVAGESSFVTIKNVTTDRNRRQGLTIGGAHHITIDSCRFINTGTYRGTKPMDGIDIEPDLTVAEFITITNCELAGNRGNGIEMYKNTKPGTAIRNVEVHNNYIHNNAYGAYIQRTENVSITNNWIACHKYGPAVKEVNSVNGVFTPNTFSPPPGQQCQR
jgi:hypothetical protein